MASNTPSVTHELLSRAHSPDSASRIFSEKIQHRTLFLRPSSPPPASTAREARRKARQEKQKRSKDAKPKPLSSRQRRKLGLHNMPKEGQKYAIFAPLNKLWLGYIREILGGQLYAGGQGCAAMLAAADFHGAELKVVRSSCPSRVGITGLVVKDSKFAFEIVTRNNEVKLVPKEGTIFRTEVPAKDVDDNAAAAGESECPEKKAFVFDIYGDQFQYRPADRANRKIRAKFLTQL